MAKKRFFTNDEDKFMVDNWGKMSVAEIAKALNRTPGTVYSRSKLLCLDTLPKTQYVVYKGGIELGEGTAEECAELAEVTRDFIYVCATEHYQNKLDARKPHRDRITVVKLGKEELA